MMKYVELCVKLKNSALAKDGLFQYRVFTQQVMLQDCYKFYLPTQVSVQSLKNVVEHFLRLAEQRTEEAQKASIEKVEEIDDLDAADTPEK
jgi:translation initiation factor 3 subunit A